MAEPVLYGIRNCDSVEKARAWLERIVVGFNPQLYQFLPW